MSTSRSPSQNVVTVSPSKLPASSLAIVVLVNPSRLATSWRRLTSGQHLVFVPVRMDVGRARRVIQDVLDLVAYRADRRPGRRLRCAPRPAPP